MVEAAIEHEPGSDPLSLDAQVCFALAVASREVIAAYRPVLEPLGLTHPQYLVMLALWEHDGLSVTELAERLNLEPATLTPLLGRLERSELVDRQRSSEDHRQRRIVLTEAGRELRDQACSIPALMLKKFDMSPTELSTINTILRDLIRRAQTEKAS